MPNSGRWQAWVTMMHQSDSVLVQLATMAAAAIVIWESLRRVPEPWQGRARSAYLLGLLILFGYLIGGSMSTTDLSLLLFGLMFVIGGALALRSAHIVEPPPPADAPEPEPEQEAE